MLALMRIPIHKCDEGNISRLIILGPYTIQKPHTQWEQQLTVTNIKRIIILVRAVTEVNGRKREARYISLSYICPKCCST